MNNRITQYSIVGSLNIKYIKKYSWFALNFKKKISLVIILVSWPYANDLMNTAFMTTAWEQLIITYKQWLVMCYQSAAM